MAIELGLVRTSLINLKFILLPHQFHVTNSKVVRYFQREINLRVQSQKCITFGKKRINKQTWRRETYAVQQITRDVIRRIPYSNLTVSLLLIII